MDIKSLAAAVVAALVIAGSTQAATIYEETFSDGSVGTPIDLDGSTPDTTTGANTWVASDWQENGSTATSATTGSLNTSADHNAFLAFTPAAGNVYTLSATMTLPVNGDGAGWVALGFADTNTTDETSFWANDTAPWLLYRPNSEVVTFDGPGVSGTSASEGNFAGPISVSLVLDTTASAWTAEWFIDGSSVRGPLTYGTNPTINYVGFGRENGNTSAVDNFTLTDNTVIPEPASLALLGLGGLALFGVRRRR